MLPPSRTTRLPWHVGRQIGSPPSGQQGPGFYRFKVGNYEVTAINDGTWFLKLNPGFSVLGAREARTALKSLEATK